MGTTLKVRLYCSLIRSILTYGLECWALARGQLRQLEQCQMRALRWLARSPARRSHESNQALRERLGVPTIESWLRVARLRRLRTALKHPREPQQALCALLGAIPWDPEAPTVTCLPYLAQMRVDIAQCCGACPLTDDGNISAEALSNIQECTEDKLVALLSYESSVERGNTRLIGPRNEPHLSCDRCNKRFDTAQRLALHKYSAHQQHNVWRKLVDTSRCPFCRRNFASVEIAKRHVTRNVCGLREAPPEAQEASTSQVSPSTLLSWVARQRGTSD